MRILVGCLDAALRQRVFDLAASCGAAVDGVADDAGVRRRLDKDEYELIVLEEGALCDVPRGAGGAGDSSVLWVRAQDAESWKALQRSLDALTAPPEGTNRDLASPGPEPPGAETR